MEEKSFNRSNHTSKKTKIKDASELPVYKDTYDMISIITDYVCNFEKSLKHTIGNKLIEESLQLFNFLQLANRYKTDKNKKQDCLEQYIIQFDLIKTLIRLCFDKKLISIKQHAKLAIYMENITKQVIGWKNY